MSQIAYAACYRRHKSNSFSFKGALSPRRQVAGHPGYAAMSMLTWWIAGDCITCGSDKDGQAQAVPGRALCIPCSCL